MSRQEALDPDQEVRELRRSSRQLVRALGLLHGHLDALDCSPPQCHALLEFAERGRLTPGELADILEIDKSTASRTLRPLRKAGLLELDPDPADQRTLPLRLSPRGRERVARIHATADAQVRGALDLLSEDERATVRRGISLYERALHRAKAREGVVVRPIEARDDPAIGQVIRTVMAEFGAVCGAGYSSEDPEVDAMHEAYRGPRSAYYVVERDGRILGGGGIAPLQGSEDDAVCELRKMHFLPEARGLGVGRDVLDRCLTAAREAGFGICYLETLRHMHRAQALYEKNGFRLLEAPRGRTGHFACDRWYERAL